MRLEDLAPDWRDIHEELVETVRWLPEDVLDAKPHDGARSIRQIVLQFLADERYWAAQLVSGYHESRPRPADAPDGRALAEALTVAREITVRSLEPFSPEGLRAVREVPADPVTNRPPTNMPVGWLFRHVLLLETIAWGQVLLRLEDERAGRRR